MAYTINKTDGTTLATITDGTIDNYESSLIRRLCGLLYVSDKDYGIIKMIMKPYLMY